MENTTRRTIKFDGQIFEVLNTLSAGPGCKPSTYEIKGGYVYNVGNVWKLQRPGQSARIVSLSF